METKRQTCVIVGANQAGVTCAFELRSEGWYGKIILIDSDPSLPYYRPPLSKSILMGTESISEHALKPIQLYEKENIELKTGIKVTAIHRNRKFVELEDGTSLDYDKLVLATGSRAFMPKIDGINEVKNVFTLRKQDDAGNIHKALETITEKRVVIIGAGFIGLESAASLTKLGAKVTILESESRVLSRVSSPEMSEFFHKLHAKNGVEIHTGKKVCCFESENKCIKVKSADNSNYQADIVILGVGVKINTELAVEADLKTENGIVVNESTQTSDKDIYAIGDCSFHFNPHYKRFIRLESVQNANDQARVAASNIAGKDKSYNSIPWFWSDQFDVKLQMVGLSDGYNELIVRKTEEQNDRKFSIWYFQDETLLAVDSVNDMKAYMIGAKFIKNNIKVNKLKLSNPNEELNPNNLSGTN